MGKKPLYWPGVVMERVTGSRGVGVQLVIATLGLAYFLKGLVRQTGLGDAPRSLPSNKKKLPRSGSLCYAHYNEPYIISASFPTSQPLLS